MSTDNESVATSVEDESEGSLAEFIDHDSDEIVAEDDEFKEQEQEQDGPEEEDEDEEAEDSNETSECASECGTEEKEETEDKEVIEQYNSDTERHGLRYEKGVRRSMRVNKGKAPVRYMDENFVCLMLSDVSCDEIYSNDDDEG